MENPTLKSLTCRTLVSRQQAKKSWLSHIQFMTWIIERRLTLDYLLFIWFESFNLCTIKTIKPNIYIRCRMQSIFSN